ncbi:MAG: sigma-70 family RNA polymerase sigma factor [Solirubrobacterales bacterium]
MTGRPESIGKNESELTRERFQAARDLAGRSAGSFRRTARRYSLCASDAEDAYQRGLEILLTKAPTEDRAQLHPWLHTVIKHEALALRGQRERLLGAELTDAGMVGGPEDLAPERERARHTAEALGGLKRSEVQCMLLKALGYSYEEIATRTGYSRTKVNRSLSEGRQRFRERVEQIRSGAACEGFESQIALAERKAVPAAKRQRLDAHLAGCAGCRARLRELRTAPRVALLAPVAWLAALRGKSSLHERIASVADRLASLVEPFMAHKVTAVAASTVALAGSGVAVETELQSNRGDRAPVERVSRAQVEAGEQGRDVIVPVSAASHEDGDPAAKRAAAPRRARAAAARPGEFEPAAEPEQLAAAPAISGRHATTQSKTSRESKPSSGMEFTP